MGKYRKKPVVIEAIQYTGKNAFEIENFARPTRTAFAGPGGSAFIETLEGRMEATVGDWIIRGVAGEIYPCKPDIFEQTYEELEEDGRVGTSIS